MVIRVIHLGTFTARDTFPGTKGTGHQSQGIQDIHIQTAFIGQVVISHHVCSCDTAMFRCGRLHGMHCGLSRREVQTLRAVSCRIDIGLVRLHMCIHHNTLVNIDIASLEIVQPGFHPSRDNHYIRGTRLTILQHDLQFIWRGFNRFHLGIGVHRHAFGFAPGLQQSTRFFPKHPRDHSRPHFHHGEVDLTQYP